MNQFSFRAQTKIIGSKGQRFSDDSLAKLSLSFNRGRKNIWYKYKQTRKHCIRLVKILEVTLSMKAMKSGNNLCLTLLLRSCKAAPVSHERGHSYPPLPGMLETRKLQAEAEEHWMPWPVGSRGQTSETQAWVWRVTWCYMLFLSVNCNHCVSAQRFSLSITRRNKQLL